MAILRVGCPMWAHRGWVGRWLPAELRPGTELEAYTRLCNAVEGNTTFYAEPTADTVARWAEQTPADFRFVFKLPRTVTHDRRLQDVAEPVRSFLDRMTPLAERIGVLQVQLPPAFGPDGDQVLAAFVRRLPTDWNWAIELRHPGWFDGGDPQRRLDDQLAERDIGRVVLDTRPLYSVEAASPAAVEERANKPRLPIATQVMGPRPMVRVIGEDRPEGTLAGLEAWIEPILGWIAEGREPYLFVHQPENLDSPDLARQIHAVVRERLPILEPLAEPMATESAQSTLFE